MKVLHIRFEFDGEEWSELKFIWKEKDIRAILYEGGIGELDILKDGRVRTFTCPKCKGAFRFTAPFGRRWRHFCEKTKRWKSLPIDS